jgi:hypothetical protein
MNTLPIELVNIIYKLIYNDVIKDIGKINCFIYAEHPEYDENGEIKDMVDMDLPYNCRMNFLRLYKYTEGKVSLYDFIDYDVNKLALKHDIEKNVKKVLPVGTRRVRTRVGTRVGIRVVRRVIKLSK